MITALTVLTYLALAACLVVGALSGFRRGLGRGAVRTVYLVLLVPIACLLGNLLATPVANKLVSGMSGSGNMLIKTTVGSSATSELFFEMVRVLAVPFMFAVVYGILETLSLIYFRHVSDKVLNKIVGDKPQHRFSHCLGGVLGFVQGAAVSVILLIPICMSVTLMATSDPAALAALNVPGVSVEDEMPAADASSPVAVLPSNKLLYSVTVLSPDDIPDEYSELREGKICMMDEAPHIINAFGHAKLAYSTATEEGNSKAVAVIRALGAINSSMGDSRVVPAVLAHTMNATSDMMKLAQTLFGLHVSDDSVATQLADEILDALKNADSSSIASIVGTLAGDGYSKGALEDLLELKKNTASGESAKQNERLLADILLSLGRNKDLRKVNNSVGDIAAGFIESSDSPLLSDEMESSKKKKVFDTVCGRLDSYSDLIGSYDGTDYDEQVKNLAYVLLSETQAHGYEMTESEATIAAVGIIAYCENGGDITPEGIMKYIGLSEEEIADILADTAIE